MKIVLSALITMAALAALVFKPLGKHKWKIMGIFAAGVALLFAFYNYRTLSYILPFYRPVNQMFYQDEFMENGEYPDSILPYIVKGKTIHFDQDFVWNEPEKETTIFWDKGCYSMDLYDFFTECDAAVVWDEVNADIGRLSAEDFEHLGNINDLLRYSYLYNNMYTEVGNGFFYYWSYGYSFPSSNLYIDGKGICENDDLYLYVSDDYTQFYLTSTPFTDGGAK